jgi:pteridine reductase
METPQTLPLALVTGGAQRLGKALGITLVNRGFALAFTYFKSEAQADVTADELRQFGQPVYPIQADLTDPSAVARLFQTVSGLPYPLKVLVNSAGIMPRSDIRTLAADTWDATLALNLRAPLLCAQHAARLMACAGGAIINLSDAGLTHTWAAYPDYQVSKAGLEMLTRQLARALAPGIRVNAIAPGLILKNEAVEPAEWARLVDRLPLKRSGGPQDISQALLFLIENEYITGQTIVVDGGYQLN